MTRPEKLKAPKSNGKSKSINNTKQAKIKEFILDNFDIRYDTFAQDLRLNKTDAVNDRDVNSIHYALNEAGVNCSVNQVHTILNSDQIPVFDPVAEFTAQFKGRKPKGFIKEICQSVECTVGFRDSAFYPKFFEHFFTKWFVNLVATACAPEPVDNPLFLCLLGEKQGVGKTEFFRRLLPIAFQPYYNEFPIIKDKDFFHQMSQFMLILDDELDGKSRQDIEAFKSLSSMKMVRVRLAFGRRLSHLRRRASFAGTGNNMEVIQDDTGNRRIIPIDVMSIDHKAYNAVNKDLLFMEAYNLWKSGYDYRLNSEDIELLESQGHDFRKISPEAELIAEFFQPGVGAPTDRFMSATEIFVLIKKVSNLNFLTLKKVGMILRAQGFRQEVRKQTSLVSKRGYSVSGGSKIFTSHF